MSRAEVEVGAGVSDWDTWYMSVPEGQGAGNSNGMIWAPSGVLKGLSLHRAS